MAADPVTLAVFSHRFRALAEEMGTTLRRSAFSANIKERQDYSCALFDQRGDMVAQAAHIPVHLGSSPLSVQAAMAAVEMRRGDVVILNDPYAGGTHLPDLTLVAPLFLGSRASPLGFVANRAHHSDIGGGTPGSMALATEIYQEGLRLPPVHLMRAGVFNSEVLQLFLANTRIADERRGDLMAQIAALRVGQQRFAQMVESFGHGLVTAMMNELQQHSARMMRAALAQLPRGIFAGEDWLDDDGFGTLRIPLRVAIDLRRRRTARVDFSGSSPQVPGGVNANRAITVAATAYVFQLLAGEDIPPNSGLLRPIELILPAASIVNAEFPAAVAAGNVETSQRIVDVLLKALATAAPERIPAASNGSMNNVSFGGYDPQRRRHFTYYETVGGGAGGGPHHDGASAVHSHMTNTLNTPIEALEASYPLRVSRYAVRRGSGGAGRHRGGDGIVREITALAAMTATVLTERRTIAPPGAAGGSPGARGENWLTSRAKRKIAGKASFELAAGARLTLLTPGGGGWGRRIRVSDSSQASPPKSGRRPKT